MRVQELIWSIDKDTLQAMSIIGTFLIVKDAIKPHNYKLFLDMNQIGVDTLARKLKEEAQIYFEEKVKSVIIFWD